MNAPLLVVLRPLGLGDFLTGVPAYRAIARRFPTHRRVLALPGALHELVPLTRAFDDACDVAPLTPLPEWLKRPDIAVDLHGRGPASQQILLATHPRKLISFANSCVPETSDGPSWDASEHEVSRWCRLANWYGAPAFPDDLLLRGSSARVPWCARGAIIVHPGAASVARRWPIKRWVEVIDGLLSRGHRVIITGSRGERNGTRAIAELSAIAPECELSGTSLSELSAIVSSSKLVVSGDTGIAHLAVAHAVPTVTLFGPTSPASWGPPAISRHRVLWTGRLGDPHGTIVDAGLLEIAVADVMREIDMVVSSEASLPAFTPSK